MGVFTVGRQVALEILMPGWWLSGSSIDLDFRNGRYYDSSAANTVSAATSYLSCTRASTGYAKNSSGTWVSFASNVLRVTDLGLLIEDSRSNNLLNSDTPATQTTASLATGSYTLWVEGSGSALASGGSATITGAASASQGNPDTFTVTVAGTVTVTVTGSLTRFQLEEGSSASSYIPTTGAAATRALDTISIIAGLNTLLVANTGTAVFDTLINFPSLAHTAMMVGDSNTGHPLLYQDGSGNDDRVHTWNLSPAFFPTNRWSTGVKVACGWNTSGASESLVGDGGTVVTGSTAWDPTGPSGFLYMGGYTTSGPNAYIRRATFWNSKLADATLQALTAP